MPISGEDKPLVSIIIPAYNAGNYLHQAIESALGQTYPNCEIIVINDGSKDKGETSRIAHSFGNKIRYFEKINGGVSSALNLGIKNMNGEYFSWLSHDDLYEPFKVEHQVRRLAELNFDPTVILFSNYHIINEQSKITSTIKLPKDQLCVFPGAPILLLGIHGCSMLIHKSVFNTVGYFDEALPGTQDYDLWLRTIPFAKYEFMEEPLIMSRWHSEQTSKKLDGYRKECSRFLLRAIRQIHTLIPTEAPEATTTYYRLLATSYAKTPFSKAFLYTAIKWLCEPDPPYRYSQKILSVLSLLRAHLKARKQSLLAL